MTETKLYWRWTRSGDTVEWNAPPWFAKTIWVILCALAVVPWACGWIYLTQQVTR